MSLFSFFGNYWTQDRILPGYRAVVLTYKPKKSSEQSTNLQGSSVSHFLDVLSAPECSAGHVESMTWS
jgi:hypothetical protein